MMQTRSPPPALQLLHDNTLLEAQRPRLPQTRPPHRPPRTQWQMVKLFWRIYKADWRTVVIAVAAINALRFSFSATNAFEHFNLDTLHHVPRLSRISAALGGIYITTAAIQAFGVLSASLKRPVLIRIYAHLSFLSALLITTAGFVTSVSYFILGDDLVAECISLSVIGSHHTRSLFHTKSLKSALPTLKTAYERCTKAYTHPPTPAPLLPLSLLLFTLLPSALFFFLSYTYYKQTTDPTHPANLIHTHTRTTTDRGNGKSKASAPRLRSREVHPLERLNLLGNTSASITTTSSTSSSPAKSVDITTLLARPRHHPKPKKTHRNTSTSSTRSPYNITPGPPSFGATAGPSRRPGVGMGLRVGGGGGTGTVVGAGAAGGSGPTHAGAGGNGGEGGYARSVWFSRTGTAGSGSYGGYGYSYGYGDVYAGRLI